MTTQQAYSLIVYHRCGGKSLGYPPNTIPTIQWAITHGAQAIEYDVVLCEDGIENRIAVIEPKLIKNAGLNINKLQWEDVQRLDTGNQKTGPLPVPTLEQVLAVVTSTGIGQQIHIKSEHPAMIPTLLKTLVHTENFVLTCFNLDLVNKVKAIGKDVRVCWLVKPAQEAGGEGTEDLTAMVTANPDAWPEYSIEELNAILQQAKDNPVDVVLLCGPRIKSPAVAEKFHQAGLEVGAWGVGTHLDIARRLIDCKLDRFTLDNPEELAL